MKRSVNNNYSDFNSYVIALMQMVIYVLIFGNRASMNKNDIIDEVKLIVIFGKKRN